METRLPQHVTSVTTFAPGSIGNIGPGLDILGCAVTGAGDIVEATRADAAGVHIMEGGHPSLPRDPRRHASGIAASEVLRLAGDARLGVTLRVRKDLPLAGGQAGSAASAVAGAVATNRLLGEPLDDVAVLGAALVAEERLSGRHADNVAPALLGGIILIRSLDPPDLVRLPVPAALRVVLVHPAQQLTTAAARAILPTTLTRELAFWQAAQVAAMVAAFATGDLGLLARALDDRVAEPARAPLLLGFTHAKRAALDAGALGCSISGAGPTSFAFADDETIAGAIANAMCAAYERSGVAATARVERIDERGARSELAFAESAG